MTYSVGMHLINRRYTCLDRLGEVMKGFIASVFAQALLQWQARGELSSSVDRLVHAVAQQRPIQRHLFGRGTTPRSSEPPTHRLFQPLPKSQSPYDFNPDNGDTPSLHAAYTCGSSPKSRSFCGTHLESHRKPASTRSGRVIHASATAVLLWRRFGRLSRNVNSY